jgi:hypothetical protein
MESSCEYGNEFAGCIKVRELSSRYTAGRPSGNAELHVVS